MTCRRARANSATVSLMLVGVNKLDLAVLANSNTWLRCLDPSAANALPGFYVIIHCDPTAANPFPIHAHTLAPSRRRLGTTHAQVRVNSKRILRPLERAGRDRSSTLEQVARSGFYKWLHKALSDRAIEDERLLGLIRDSYTISGGCAAHLRSSEICAKPKKAVASIAWPGSCAATRSRRYAATKRRGRSRGAINYCAQPAQSRIHCRCTRSRLGH